LAMAEGAAIAASSSLPTVGSVISPGE